LSSNSSASSFFPPKKEGRMLMEHLNTDKDTG
jgi:hypothetical protein